MYSHTMVGSNDLARSRAFYDALFAVLGGSPASEDEQGRLFYMHNNSMFVVTSPINGQPATISNGATIGFAMASPLQVDAWHKAGVDHGGAAIEDPPGVRDTMLGDLYLAYLRDPDGNKLCALHQMSAKK